MRRCNNNSCRSFAVTALLACAHVSQWAGPRRVDAALLPSTQRDDVHSNADPRGDSSLSNNTAPATGRPTTLQDEVFVVGCGNSGTTIMLRLIGNHPNIYCTPYETCALCRHAVWDEEKGVEEWKRSAMRLARIDAAALEAGYTRWVEKTPIHVRYLDKLFLLRPRAKVIFMIRDGRDVVSSFKGRRRPDNAAAAVRDGAERWVNDTRAGLRYAAHPHVLTMRYETFARHPKDAMAKVFAFIGEDFKPEDIFLDEQTTQFNGVASEKVRDRPVDEAKDHEALRAYQISHGIFDGRQRWIAPPPRGLTSEERNVVHRIAGPLLHELGYTEDDKGTWV
eukprot:m.77619 g.77619  ORF g.77619 m.77619 type:complete len:336 (-) comp9153_c0_seq2:116-1123(-)